MGCQYFFLFLHNIFQKRGGVFILDSIIAQLLEADIKALRTIYSMRCMSEDLLHRYIYKYSNETETLDRIRFLIDLRLIEVIECGNGDCIFCLTVLGVNIVRKLSPVPLYKIHPKTGERIYEVQAKELRPAMFIINHQLHLNELSLMIQEKCGIPLSAYKDSKFASNFTYAQPDGVFELEKYDVFLEMDMCNEEMPALVEKWNHYRNYFASQDYYLRRNRPIIVLFATENIIRMHEQRRGTVLRSLSRTIFDLFGSNFNCYIGTSEYCARVFAEIYQSSSFTVHKLFEQHGYTCPKLNSAKATQFLKNSAGQGLYVCSYQQRPVSALKQVIYFEKIQTMHKTKWPLVMVCNSDKEILKDLNACEVLHTPGVYFSTPKRLNTKPLDQALFQFDSLGNRILKGDC